MYFYYFDVKTEFTQINHYIRKRFNDIAFLIKSPFKEINKLDTEHIPFLSVAAAISILAPLIFSFPTIVTLDYFNHCLHFPPFLELDSTQKQVSKISESLKDLNISEDTVKDPESLELLNMAKGYYHKKKAKFETEINDNITSSLPVILVLKAKDHNGAFSYPQIYIKGVYNSLEELKKKFHVIVIDDITHIDQINEELKKITKEIHQIWFLAHGSHSSMLLNDNNKINNSNLNQISEQLQKKLTKDANVILNSCSTGSKLHFSDNLAKTFSKLLPGRTIWAPKLNISISTYGFEEKELKVHFWVNMSRFEVLIDKIWNFFKLYHLRKVGIDWNVTAKYIDGKDCS